MDDPYELCSSNFVLNFSKSIQQIMRKLLYLFMVLCVSFQMKAQTVVDIIVGSPDHTILETAVIAAELADDLSGPGPFTVFAPTDAAFAALPAGTVDALLADPTGELATILLYHVLGLEAFSTDLSDGMMVTTLQGEEITVTINGNGVFINDAQVTLANLDAENGVVHVIDAVLLPPVMPTNTIMDIVTNSADHNTLEVALLASGLNETLANPGEFTLFAPTDAAFNLLPAGTVDALLADPNGQLVEILLYHVLGGAVLSSALEDGMVVNTAQGSDVTVTINANGVFINNAQVIVADITADNGVVHVIDAVLLPPAQTSTVVDIIVNSPDHNTLEAAVVAAGLVEALSGPGPFTVFAPTDAAFDALPAGTVEALLADPGGALTQILLYHVVGATALSTDLFDGQVIATVNGATVTVSINGGVFINDAQVTVADIIADNGVVHVINAVLLPPAPQVEGCTAIEACNFNPEATIEDGSCILAGEPCDDANDNTINDVLGADCVCAGELLGCTDGTACNYNMEAVAEDGSCVFVGDSCDDNNAATTNDVVTADCGCEGILPSNTVVDVIVNSPNHNTLESAVILAGLADDLSGTGPFTVFAPTDAAFAALPAGVLDALLADPTGALTQVLLYHAVSGLALSTDLTDAMMIQTIQGQNVTVTINANGVFINDAQVIVADILADNGVVHVIDAVLVPANDPEPVTVVDIIVNSADHTTLETAVIAAGLADDLSGDGPFTVFAPTDAAFAALPAGALDALLADPTGALVNVLLYHALSGTVLSTSLSNGMMATTIQGSDITVTINANGVFINDAQVIVADILADNGVVHVIDAVLLPPAPPTNTILDIVVNSADHTILETAVVAAGLQGALSGPGPLTVFAPTDAAFAALPSGALDALLADPTGALTQVLLYHAVGGVALSTDLTDGMMITTIQGQDITVTINANGVFINDAQVTVADIIADNGVVHVINAVLLPPPPPVEGCTASEACNYNPDATIDDASCILPGEPCDDANANTTNDVLGLDCVCAGELLGCTEMTACNYDMAAIVDNGSCQFPGDNCDDNDAATINDVFGADCGCAGIISTNTVVDVIVNSPDHNTLETAVILAGLADDLSATGPFTVFAPTDAAFEALPAGVLDAVLADPNGLLTQILLYHVVSGSVLSTDLMDGMVVPTLQGSTVSVTIAGDNVIINNALVTVANIIADNGVVHVINAVLLPPAPPVEGCTAIEACNYNPDATIDDASCILPGEPCDDANANTINDVLGLDCVCAGELLGCTDMTACNYDMAAIVDNGSCQFPGDNCDDNNAATINDVFGADCGCAGIISNNTVVDVIVNSPDHNTLETAVILAGLADDLSATGPFTVFAPTDAAFEALPAGVLDAVLADPNGLLTQILLYHVVSGSVLSTDLMDGMVVPTLQGSTVTVTIAGDNVFINDALVTVANIIADNGVVHVINAVLLPPAPPVEGCTAMEACNYNPDATIDDASCILPGEPCDDMNDNTINDVLGADCVCAGDALGCTDMSACNYDMNAAIDNGTCQFPGDACDDGNAGTADDVYGADCVCAGTSTSNTILDIVVNSADHNTLEAAVVAAGLQSALSGEGPLTLFAPTDDAFDALPAGVLASLLADPTGALTQVLLYHAVGGVALSTDLTDGMMITTIQGQDITVTINANGVFINDAQVIVADIIADNGVVHVIDAVLVPENDPEPVTVLDIIVNSADHTTLETAVIAAGLADDLSGDGPFTVFAPTDAAFAALPAGVLDALLADPTGALAQVLLYHVVSGEALSSSLSNGQTITTLQGQVVTVSITGGNVFINDAQVIVADIMADNGVVHVINAVLTPSTSVNEVTMNSLVVYPNPVAEQLTISMPSMNGSTVYTIYSITGELITTGNLYSTTTISTDALAQGMYQLKVVNGNDCVTRSFMKK